jgi:AAA15 family ATPase/GTPase
MITDFELSGFRCFEPFGLHGLTRLNVVTGGNASGKSAFLEALFIGARGIGESLVMLNNYRGIQSNLPSPVPGLSFPIGVTPFNPMISPASFKGSWEHYFRSVKTISEEKEISLIVSPRISISTTDSEETSRTLNVFFQEQSGANVIVPPQTGSVAQSITPLIFERRTGRQSVRQILTIGPMGQLQAQPHLPEFGPSIFIFPATASYSEEDNMTWFSRLRETGQLQSVMERIRESFPFIDGLEILKPSGVDGLYAIMSSGEVRRLSTVSAGVNKIISIFLACHNLRNGIVLIDEIENGIYYEKYGFFWDALFKFAENTQNQIFAASHSDECIQALLPTIEAHDVGKFALLRAERLNGECVVRHIPGETFRATLRRGGEPRGTAEVDPPQKTRTLNQNADEDEDN